MISCILNGSAKYIKLTDEGLVKGYEHIENKQMNKNFTAERKIFGLYLSFPPEDYLSQKGIDELKDYHRTMGGPGMVFC